MTAVPKIGDELQSLLRLRARALTVGWAQRRRAANASISPPSVSSWVLSQGSSFPVRRKLRGAVTASGTPQPTSITSPRLRPLPGGRALGRGRRGGEGSARGGEKRLYSCEEELGAAARLRDTRSLRLPALPLVPSTVPEVPLGHPFGGTRRFAAGGAVRCALFCALQGDAPGAWEVQGWGQRGNFPEVSAGAAVRWASQSQN